MTSLWTNTKSMHQPVLQLRSCLLSLLSGSPFIIVSKDASAYKGSWVFRAASSLGFLQALRILFFSFDIPLSLSHSNMRYMLEAMTRLPDSWTPTKTPAKEKEQNALDEHDSFQQSLAYSFYKQKWKMCEHYPVSLWHNCIWLWQHRSVLTICIILHPCLWHPCLSRATIFMRLLHSISEPGFSDHLQENQHHTVLRRIQKDSWMTYRFSGSSVSYSICISLPLSYLPDKHSHYHVLSFDFFLLNENWIQYNIWIML